MTTSEIARYDRQMTIDYEREYMITLFDDHTHNKASTELSSALSYFHILLNGYFIIATASGYGLVNEGEIAMNNYLITLMARCGVFLLSWIAFFLVCIFNCIPKFKLIIMLKNHVRNVALNILYTTY